MAERANIKCSISYMEIMKENVHNDGKRKRLKHIKIEEVTQWNK